MPFPAVTFPMQLPPEVRRELEALLAQLNEGYLLEEHKDDGSHGDITADSVTSDAVYLRSPASDAVIKFYANGDASVVLQQGESSTLASLEVNNLTAIVLNVSDLGTIIGNTPQLRWYEADATGNNHLWRAIADGERWKIEALDDFGTLTATPLELARDGTALSPVYVIGSADTSGVRLKNASGILHVRAGDDSGFAQVAASDVGAQVSMQSPIYVIGSANTSGIRLRVNSGVAEVREGDDSAYAPLNVLYLFASEHVFIDDGASNDPSLCFAADQNTGFYQPTTDAVGVAVGGLGGFTFSPTGGGVGYMFTVNSGAFGTGAVAGSRLLIGRNTSGSGAAGTFSLQRLGGTIDTLWVDNAGDFRIGSGIPREDGSVSDTSGTVVGTQTSTRAEKIILGERFDYETSLRHVLDAPVFDFKYRNNRFNGEVFTGTTTDDAPIFGMDGGKSLNTVSAIGHLMQAVKAQQKQIEQLQRQVAELQGRS